MRRKAGRSLKIVAFGLAITLLACGTETRTVIFDFAPLPFPNKPALTFSGPDTITSQSTRPMLADGVVDAANNVWLLGHGFDTMVFDFPDWKGRKVSLQRPEAAEEGAPPVPGQLAVNPTGMAVTWPDSSAAAVLEGSSWRQVQLPSMRTELSRNGDLLVPTANKSWQRLGLDGQLKCTYATNAENPHVSGDSDGSFAVLSRDLLLECFNAQGQKSLEIALPKHDQQVELTYRDLYLHRDRLYILYGRGEHTTSYLLVLDLRGTIRNHWTLSLASDAIDTNGRMLLLFDTSSAQATVFPLAL